MIALIFFRVRYHILGFLHCCERIRIRNFLLDVEGNTVFPNRLTQKNIYCGRNIKAKIREELFCFLFDFFIDLNAESS